MHISHKSQKACDCGLNPVQVDAGDKDAYMQERSKRWVNFNFFAMWWLGSMVPFWWVLLLSSMEGFGWGQMLGVCKMEEWEDKSGGG